MTETGLDSTERSGPTGAVRRRLLDGAASAVDRHGLRDVRVSHILAAAGVSRRTLYQYFAGKDELMLALYDQVVEQLMARIHASVQNASDYSARVFAGIDEYLKFQEDGGNLIAVLQAEAASPASPMNPSRERAIDQLVQLVEDESAGLLPQRIDPLAYRAVFIAVEGLVIQQKAGGVFTPEMRQRVGNIVRPLLMRVLTGSTWFPAAD